VNSNRYAAQRLSSSPINLTGNAQPVLLKNSTRSRPQGRNGDNPSNWITCEWLTILELPRGGLIEMLDVATSSLLYSQ
jgi:hypothetical protein